MFERYTQEARRTIFFARNEAVQFGSPYIQSEHLLLGLRHADQSLVDTFLRSPGIEGMRKQIEERTGIREKVPVSADLPLNNESKRILAHAAKEAESLSHNVIGTPHLLLGILREEQCLAAKLLRERGVDLETARERIARAPQEKLGIPQWTQRTPPGQLERTFTSPGLPPGYDSHKLLYNHSAETLILELRTNPASVLPTRLFTRHKDQEAYDQIGSPALDESYQSPVTYEGFPVVVFTSFNRKTYEWVAYSFNLNTRELAVCLSPEKLRLIEPHRRLWISELVSLAEHNRIIYVNIAVEPVSGREITQNYLARVDLADQRVTLLSRLLDHQF